MAIIVVDPRDGAHVETSVKVLCRAGIKARKPKRPFAKGFIYVNPGQTKRAADLLAASGISASVRPD